MSNSGSTKDLGLSLLYVVFVLAVFFLSIDMLIGALSDLGGETAESVMVVTANPFVSLFIGLLITALIQSSSVTTSMVVALVASGSLDMQRAIPMVMGANIGTTLTGNIISLSFITKKEEFRRAFSASLLHDHFNILSVIILFPLQYKYNLLGMAADHVTSFLTLKDSQLSQAFLAGPYGERMRISEFVLNVIGHPGISLFAAVILLFSSVKLLTQTIYRVFKGTVKIKTENLVFSNSVKSFGWGAGITALIQSSSITTSVLVPVVAAGKIRVREVYPFIIGANIGTTITAMLAALFKSPAAVSVAVAHLMFNLIGGAVFLLIPGLKKLPIIISESIGNLCLSYRILSVIYIIIVFFLLPFAFIYMTK